MKVKVTISVSEAVMKKTKQWCEDHERSMAWLVKKLLRELVEPKKNLKLLSHGKIERSQPHSGDGDRVH